MNKIRRPRDENTHLDAPEPPESRRELGALVEPTEIYQCCRYDAALGDRDNWRRVERPSLHLEDSLHVRTTRYPALSLINAWDRVTRPHANMRMGIPVRYISISAQIWL